MNNRTEWIGFALACTALFAACDDGGVTTPFGESGTDGPTSASDGATDTASDASATASDTIDSVRQCNDIAGDNDVQVLGKNGLKTLKNIAKSNTK